MLYLLKKRSTVDSRTKAYPTKDYARCQAVWRDNGMKTMHDFLVWYNNRDVVPFLDAIDKTICLLQTAEHRYVQRRCKRPGTDIALSLQRTSVEHLLHCLQPDEQAICTCSSKTISLVVRPSYFIATMKRTSPRYGAKKRVDRLWGVRCQCSVPVGVDAGHAYGLVHAS